MKLRYRFHIKGLDLVKNDQGQLILPSHVALVDPMILFAVLSQKCKVHPVVTSSFFENPILKPFFKLIGAVGIGDFEADQGSKENVSLVIQNLLQQLEQKQSILLYPQGALARQGFQVLNGKKTAYELTKNAPKRSKILTVSIKGLRGSRSSYAWTGKSPNLFLFFLKGIGFSLLNGLFFIPKRDVFITIENQTNSLKKIAQKGIDDFNTTLEHVYNQGEEEKIHYLSGLFYLNTVRYHPIPSKIVGSIEDLKSAKDFSQEVLDNEVQTFIIHKIKEIKPDFQEEISVNSNVVLDLMFDSLDVAELKSSVLAHFPKSSNTPLSHLKLVGDFILMGMGKGEQEGLKPCDWKYTLSKQTLYAYLKDTVKESSTLLDSMKKTFKRCKKDQTTFCYDTLLGIQTFKDFLLKVYVIAELIKQKNS
ncbi:MAG: 1-acyl-sn-glycerol-3-phosphate acyltransferase [Patescibacteria group bacterium]|nr:1-acyl-sn-glycerol-3-phosphate acyltransferase [Patescibacteria group bacterium]